MSPFFLSKLKSKSRKIENKKAPNIAFIRIAHLLKPLKILTNSKIIKPKSDPIKKSARKRLSENEYISL
jgi:hypothetical protein